MTQKSYLEPSEDKVRIVKAWLHKYRIKGYWFTYPDELAMYIPAPKEERTDIFIKLRDHYARKIKADLESCLQLQNFFERDSFLDDELNDVHSWLHGAVLEYTDHTAEGRRPAAELMEGIIKDLVYDVNQWGINLGDDNKQAPNAPRKSLKTRLEGKGYKFESKNVGDRKILFFILQDIILAFKKGNLGVKQITNAIVELFDDLGYDTTDSKNSKNPKAVIKAHVRPIVEEFFPNELYKP